MTVGIDDIGGASDASVFRRAIRRVNWKIIRGGRDFSVTYHVSMFLPLATVFILSYK